MRTPLLLLPFFVALSACALSHELAGARPAFDAGVVRDAGALGDAARGVDAGPSCAPDLCCTPSPRPGECACISGTWRCEGPADSGVFACPPDPASLLGTACDASLAGTTCGVCPDPCGPCDLVACDGSMWTAPARPGPYCGDRFPCGAITCQQYTQTCDVDLSDVAGFPDTYRCAAYPDHCAPDAGCACFTGSGAACSDDGSGGLTLRYPGG